MNPYSIDTKALDALLSSRDPHSQPAESLPPLSRSKIPFVTAPLYNEPHVPRRSLSTSNIRPASTRRSELFALNRPSSPSCMDGGDRNNHMIIPPHGSNTDNSAVIHNGHGHTGTGLVHRDCLIGGKSHDTDSQSTYERSPQPSASNSLMCIPSKPSTPNLEPSGLSLMLSSDTDSIGPVTDENRPSSQLSSQHLHSLSQPIGGMKLETKPALTYFSRFVEHLHEDGAYISRSPSPVTLDDVVNTAAIASQANLVKHKRSIFRRRSTVQIRQPAPPPVPVRQWSTPSSVARQSQQHQTFVPIPSPSPSMQAKAKGFGLGRSKPTPKAVDGAPALMTTGAGRVSIPQSLPRSLFGKARSSNTATTETTPTFEPPPHHAHRAPRPRTLFTESLHLGDDSPFPSALLRSGGSSSIMPSHYPSTSSSTPNPSALPATPSFSPIAAECAAPSRFSLLQRAKSVMLHPPRPNPCPVADVMCSPEAESVSQSQRNGGLEGSNEHWSGRTILRGPTGTIKAFKSSSDHLYRSPSTLDPVKTTINTSSLPPSTHNTKPHTFSVPILSTPTRIPPQGIPSSPYSLDARSSSASHSMSMWEYEVEVRPRKVRPKSFVGKLFAHSN